MSDGPYEYRVGSTNCGRPPEYGDANEVFAVEAAARQLAADLATRGAHEEVWIERRPCVDWERLP